MPKKPGRLARVRAIHVTWTLIAIIVLAACASSTTLAPPAEEHLALIELEAADTAKAAYGMGDLVAGDDLAGSVAEPSLVDGASWAAQADARVDDALIVRMASLELEAADVAAVLLEARAEIGSLGGYVAGSDEYDQADRRWATVTYRVPVDRFDDAIDALRGLSDRVVRESTQSQEVTATVVDLDARITNLRASEAALVEIMDRSGRIEDVLAVQMRLEDVRGQIERLEAQRASLADQAALSTLTVTWITPVAAVTVAQEGWSLAAQVDAALAQTVQALQGLVGLAVWFFVVPLPLLGIPLLVVGIGAAWLRRRTRRGDASGPGGGAAVSASAVD